MLTTLRSKPTSPHDSPHTSPRLSPIVAAMSQASSWGVDGSSESMTRALSGGTAFLGRASIFGGMTLSQGFSVGIPSAFAASNTRVMLSWIWLTYEPLESLPDMVSPRIIAMYMSLSIVGVICSSLTWPMWRQTAMSCQRWVNREELEREQRTDTLVRRSSYLDVVGTHPEWLGAPFVEEAEYLRDVDERAWRSEYLGEVTGTGGSVFGNVVGRRLTDAQCRGFSRT